MKIRTVRRKTREFDQALAGAREIRCYSLENYFVGQEMREGDPGRIMPPRDWLRRELERFDFAKLTRDDDTNVYNLRVHGNLWYEFSA